MNHISIRCNKIEHWVHLRCASVRQTQYTDTWSCHLHREFRLTSHRQNTTTPPDPGPSPLPTPNIYTTHTTAIQTQTHVQHSRTGLVNTKPNTHIPSRSLSTHTAHRKAHTHLTHFTNSSHPTHHTYP